MGLDVLDGPLDGLGDGGCDGEMSALGLESVLVSDVLELDGGAVGGGVLELTLGSNCVAFLTGYAGRAILGGGDAVLGLVAVRVGAIGRAVRGLTEDGNGLLLLGRGDGHEGEGGDDLELSRFRELVIWFLSKTVLFIVFKSFNLKKRNI